MVFWTRILLMRVVVVFLCCYWCDVSYIVDLWFDIKLIPQLIIGTISLHPFLFYMFVVCLVVKSYFYGFFAGLQRVFFSTKTILLILFITLLLGSLWATQSGTWGYLWVNDLIEWVLLAFILYGLYMIHFFQINKKHINSNLLLFVIITLLLSLRLNLWPTRHNFMGVTLAIAWTSFFYSSACVFTLFNFLNTGLVYFRINWYFGALVYLVWLSADLATKWLFTVLYVYFIQVSTNKLAHRVYAHSFVMVFFCLWLIPFNAFEVVYNMEISLGVHTLTYFESFMHLLTKYSFQQNNISLLEFVEYGYESIIVVLSNWMPGITLYTNLTNSQLISVIVWIISFVKMVEFRLLY